MAPRSIRKQRCAIAISVALVLTCSVSAAQAEGDIALGEYLASECVTCHQITGRTSGGIPAIIGWPEDLFVSVMQAYRNKERDNKVMQAITSTLSDADIHALAAYYGSLKEQPPQ